MDENVIFEYGTQVLTELFVNREEEQHRLESNFAGGQNTIIIAPRRWGKSSLVAQMEYRMKRNKKVRFCYMDMFGIRSEKEFYETLLIEVVKATSSRVEERIKVFQEFVRRIVPKISFGVTPDQEWSLSVDLKEARRNFSEIIDLPERIGKARGLRIIMCIDEFQNISYFDRDISFQKKLRAHWQKHQQTAYCLYGSRRHMMMDIFENQASPFYHFGSLMLLNRIEEKHWIPFIQRIFRSNKKNISVAMASQITQRMENFPYYVQQYGQEVLLHTQRTVTEETLDTALESILNRNTIFYHRDIESLTNIQLNLLKAIMAGETRLTTNEVVRKYDLGNAQNTYRAKDALRNKDIIDDFEPQIIILDPVFKIWFKKYLLPKYHYED